MSSLAATELTTAEVEHRLRGKKVDVTGLAFQTVLVASLAVSVAVLAVLVFDVVDKAQPTFADRGADFLTSNTSFDIEKVGIWQGLKGTLWIALFVIVLAFPLGVFAAIYLEEYATDNWFTRLVDVNIRNLAGVPSIVYGILGFSIFVKALSWFTGGASVIAAGITLSLLVLPIVIITSAEAIRAVPDALREGGYGVGCTRLEVVRHHVLPYAAPGILTGTVLSLARALGEAAPLILIGAKTGFFTDPDGFFGQLQGDFTALPMMVFNFARQPDPALRDQTASAAIVVLLVIVILINATGILLRNRYEKKRST